MRKLNGALAMGLIVVATLGGLMAAPALAADAPPTSNANQSMAKTDRVKMPKEAHMSRQRVEALQTALDKSGAKLSVDGVWGPKTERAVKVFQKDHGIAATGHLDRATKEVLPKA